jgi:hypothetical protein
MWMDGQERSTPVSSCHCVRSEAIFMQLYNETFPSNACKRGNVLYVKAFLSPPVRAAPYLLGFMYISVPLRQPSPLFGSG